MNYNNETPVNHMGKVYNNVGWVRGTVPTNGEWGAYLWTLQNRLAFKTSESNLWQHYSPAGAVVAITNVFVGSIGNFPPMTETNDIGPKLLLATNNFLGANHGEVKEYKVDITNIFYQLAIPDIWITPREADACVGGSNVQYSVIGANLPAGVDWSISPELTNGAGIQSTGDWHYAEVAPGNVAMNYKVRATSIDSTNFYDEVDLSVLKIDIVETNIYLAVSNTVSLNLTPDSSLDAQWAVIPTVQNGAAIQGSSVGTSVVINAESVPTNYMVKAYAPDFTNCYDTCSMTVLKVESVELVSGAANQNVIPPHTWATVKNTNSSPEYVTVKAVLNPDIDEANLPDGLVTWNGGESVEGHPLQRKAGKQSAIHTQLVASCGSSSATGDVWVVWSDLEIRMTGSTTNTPNSARFENNYDASENLGARLYDYRDQASNFISRAAAGKVAPIGKLEPAGINAITTNKWTIEREIIRHDYKDGAVWQERWLESWTYDTTYYEPFKIFTPDNLDQIYDLDGPNIAKYQGLSGIVTNSCERYNHFRQWVTWNGNKCSDYSTWYWYARWKDNTNLDLQVELKDVGTGNPDFPTNVPYYSPP